MDVEDPEALRAIAEKVRASGARLLIAALGCPKQELFLARCGHATGASVGIGVGASIDFLAGKSRRAPGWLGRLGLEWLHRWWQEPARLGGRYAADALYLARLLRQLLGARTKVVEAERPRREVDTGSGTGGLEKTAESARALA